MGFPAGSAGRDISLCPFRERLKFAVTKLCTMPSNLSLPGTCGCWLWSNPRPSVPAYSILTCPFRLLRADGTVFIVICPPVVSIVEIQHISSGSFVLSDSCIARWFLRMRRVLSFIDAVDCHMFPGTHRRRRLLPSMSSVCGNMGICVLLLRLDCVFDQSNEESSDFRPGGGVPLPCTQ